MSLIVSICFVIELFPILTLPFGGSVTVGKMLPLIFFTYFYGLKSGIFAGLIYSILQMIIFFHIPPAKTFFAFTLAILFDYIIPYLSIGFTALFKNTFCNVKKYFTISIVFSYTVRFLCCAFSGVVIWSKYIPKEYNIWIYSVVYNLIYIVPEIIIALIICNVLINFFVPKSSSHTL